ncbi:MAG: phospholipid carrier-dependent glycosyltransferase [Opitutaceae bacterium]|nr:phospholipid carrier-dependent glycosyltransferase [Opitutaceae bacterium]
MRKPVLVTLCFLVAWAGGALSWVARQADNPLLDQDEVYWIGSAYYYDLAWVRRDWRHEAWQWLPARENPPVCKYVLGLGLATAGHRVESIENLAYFYLKWLRWEKNPAAAPANLAEEKRAEVVRAAGPAFRQQVIEGRRAPLPRAVVGAARTTVLVCAVLGSLLLFLLGWSTGDRLAGLIASQVILLHPVATAAAGHAMSDTIALLFAIAAAWAVAAWHRQLTAPIPPAGARGLGAALLAGVMLALACGAKMNALVLVLLAGVMTALAITQRWREGARRAAVQAGAHGLVVLAAALAVFVAINPAILNDFPGAIAATITEHRSTEAAQVDLHHPSPAGLGGKLAAVVTMAFHGWYFFAVMLGVVVWVAVRRWSDRAVRVAVIWWVLALGAVTWWLPFAWPRYVLPLLAPSAWLTGLALSAAGRSLVESIRRTRSATESPALP